LAVVLNSFIQFPPAGGGSVNVTFVAADHYAASPTSSRIVSWPAGTQIGDMVFVSGQETSGNDVTVNSASGGWTKYTVDPGIFVTYKFVTALDLAGNLTINYAFAANASFLVASYRGVVGINTRGISFTFGELTMPGFTKSPSDSVVLSFSVVEETSASTATVTHPATFTSRINTYSSGGSSTYYLGLADNISSYVDGSSVTWDVVFGLGFTSAGALIELY
jgi:hypothetical protein